MRQNVLSSRPLPPAPQAIACSPSFACGVRRYSLSMVIPLVGNPAAEDAGQAGMTRWYFLQALRRFYLVLCINIALPLKDCKKKELSQEKLDVEP